jgi:hypothetical protein
MQRTDFKINKHFYAGGQYVTETSPGYRLKMKPRGRKKIESQMQAIPPAMPDAIINHRMPKNKIRYHVAPSIPAHA